MTGETIVKRNLLVLLTFLMVAGAAGCNYTDFQRAYGRTYVADLFYKPEFPPDPMKDIEKRQAALAAALARWRTSWPHEEEPYEVGVGDVLQVRVFPGGSTDAQVLDVVVDEDGAISLPLIGILTAEGLTLAEIEKQVAALYGQGYYREPVVSIAVSQFRSKEVYVTGAVGQPGVQVISKNRIPLLEALLKAGATRQDAADEAIVTRASRLAEPVVEVIGEAGPGTAGAPPVESVRISITGLMEGTEPEQNIWVSAGDIVHVPVEVPKTFTIVGYVRHPGIFPIPKDRELGMLDALALAGGPVWSSRTEHTKLLRETAEGRQVFEIDLTRVASAKDPDRRVMPDDTIIVTTTWLMRFLDGILYAFRFQGALYAY
jgi:protein involved in polysaccharide export with SLBB domain